jgi:hypothetical protein
MTASRKSSSCSFRQRPKPLLAILLFLLLSVAAIPGVDRAHAQLTGKGGISGTITDPTGAAIPGAKITITNVANGVAIRTTSTAAGDFSVSTLDPGDYNVVIAAQGFEQLTQQNVRVNALETQTFNPKLSVGSSSQTVTVSTAPPALETSNATLGATMESEMYSALPLQMGAGGQPDQRRATDFAALMPGVQANETNGNLTTNTGVVNGSGSRGAASAVYIDGLAFTSVAGEGDPRFVWTAISVDAVDQFQVQTAGYSALYEGQGVQNYTIKQGGDRYHGAVYEFFRNTALDTWGFFGPQNINPVTGKAIKPIEHQNEYGIYLSGPLWPKLKNRLFFFGNYDGYRYSRVLPTFMTFPTLAEQQGNFSAITTSGQVNQIYDPTSQSACTAANKNVQCRYPYANNIIPTAQLSPVVLKMQSLIPALTNQSPVNNYLAQNFSGLSNWSTTERIDFVINSSNSLTLIAGIGRQASSVPVGQTTAGRNVGPVPYNYGQAYAPKTAVSAIEETYTITPHLVNQFKYGFGRYNGPTINADLGPAYAASSFGIAGLPSGQAQTSFPITTFTGTDAPTQWAGTTGSFAISNSYILLDNLQWVKGRHTLSFGGQIGWMQYQNNTATGGTTNLTIANTTNETGGFQSNGTTLISNTGIAYASFVLGYIDKGSFTQNVVQETGARFRPMSPYVQDDWKVTSRLTLNLGLRYDFYPTYREAHNVQSFFNPTMANPVTGSPGAIQYTGTGANTCNCNSPVNNYYRNVGPRLGFSFQSDPHTVWRGSWGVIYTHGNGVGGAANSRTGAGTLGFSASPSFASNTSTFLPTFFLTSTNSTIPAYQPALGVASGNAYGTGYTNTTGYTAAPSTVGYADPYYGGRAPQYINYSFGFQHQWTNNFTSSINYVGSQGHFLITDGGNPRGLWSNALDPKYLFLGANLSTAVGKLPGGYQAFAAANGLPYYSWFNTGQALSTALKPFPQYGLTDTYADVANANYNSLQVSLMKRPSKGFTFMVNYTWSRSIDDGGTFRTGYAIPAAYSNNGRAYAADAIERGVSTSNQPHHLVASGVWDLPFGKGDLGGSQAWERAILGGFKFSGIFQAYSGSPLAILGSSCQTNPALTTTACEPTMNPLYSGSARVNGGWGAGITAANPSAISYIAPSGGTLAAPTGPFIAPTSTLLNSVWAPAYTFGNAPRTAPYNLYGPGNYDVDISLRRSFGLHLGESSRLSLQADMYNVSNHTRFGGIGTTLGSSNFGAVSTQANTSRDIQLSGRIEF